MPTIEPAQPDQNRLDYETAETLVVAERRQLRAVANDVRTVIIALLRERALSTQQLSAELGIPKGTVGYHLKVLERAGLVRIVGTRKVRAVTEKFYGRTARLFLFQPEDPADDRAIGASMLRQAAGEIERAPVIAACGLPRARLAPKDAKRLERRLRRLSDDFLGAETTTGTLYVFGYGLWPAEPPDA